MNGIPAARAIEFVWSTEYGMRIRPNRRDRRSRPTSPNYEARSTTPSNGRAMDIAWRSTRVRSMPHASLLSSGDGERRSNKILRTLPSSSKRVLTCGVGSPPPTWNWADIRLVLEELEALTMEPPLREQLAGLHRASACRPSRYRASARRRRDHRDPQRIHRVPRADRRRLGGGLGYR